MPFQLLRKYLFKNQEPCKSLIQRHRMKRFILTGAPGSGKTAIIRQLELDGFSVVEEAATDIIAQAQAQGIAEPWKHASFIDSIAELQKQRQVGASSETQIKYSFTIDRRSAPRRWRPTLDILFPARLRAN